MATDKNREIVVGTLFPKSMKHLQQLVMDCDACAKSYGKKSWLGADKFQPKFEKFQRTIMTCAFSLVEDGVVSDPGNPSEVLPQIDKAMLMLAATYSSWPEAFSFWRSFVDTPRSSSSNKGVEQSVKARRYSPMQDVKPESPINADGAALKRDVRDRGVEQSMSSVRCAACGLERSISPGAQGFHCAGCRQYNEVGSAPS